MNSTPTTVFVCAGLEKTFDQWDPLINGQDENLIEGTNITVLQSVIWTASVTAGNTEISQLMIHLVRGPVAQDVKTACLTFQDNIFVVMVRKNNLYLILRTGLGFFLRKSVATYFSSSAISSLFTPTYIILTIFISVCKVKWMGYVTHADSLFGCDFTPESSYSMIAVWLCDDASTNHIKGWGMVIVQGILGCLYTTGFNTHFKFVVYIPYMYI